MYTRVVRFTDADPERVQQLLERVRASGGPPPGVNATGLRILVDESQHTAVVVQEFSSAEDMAQAAKVLDAMDSSETPGTRASIDECELKLELRV
jgi:hypothetical protein